ncbi:MAG: cobalt-zinc-cadmium efflux system outer membrane protein [bacterium]|jgi:cobalt-zinc-cadmium efflux system outer membrane protein
MIQKAIFAFCTCLVSNFVFSQTTDVETILQKIEHNNVELKGFDNYIEGNKNALKNTNVLPNQEISGYYLPYGNSLIGKYSEIQISQSFEFPTVYSVRSELISRQRAQLQYAYEQKRQQILLQSKKAILEVIALNKIDIVQQQRLSNAKTLFEHNQILFDKGEIGILELNKAKVAYLNLQFKLEHNKLDRQTSLNVLQNLNGGDSIDITQTDYESTFMLPNEDSIWQEKIILSPTIQFHIQSENVSYQQVNLAKAKALPDLTVGYNYQGFTTDNVSGFYAGLSLPIWGNRLRSRAAQSNLSYSKSNTIVQVQTIKSDFKSLFYKYQSLLTMYNEYNTTLQVLNSEGLLLKAYQLGDISFSEYYVELEFYYSALDALLDMEKQLHLIKVQLLAHQL